jgi:hypothetical protein
MSAAANATKAATEWITVPEACGLLGTNRAGVLQLVVRGEITADVRGRYTFVSRASIERYLASK